jgi:hypothetical protein
MDIEASARVLRIKSNVTKGTYVRTRRYIYDYPRIVYKLIFR